MSMSRGSRARVAFRLRRSVPVLLSLVVLGWGAVADTVAAPGPAPAASAQAEPEPDALEGIGTINNLFELIYDISEASGIESADDLAELLENGSKYSQAFSVFSKILDVASASKLLYKCYTGLATGSEDEFAEGVNGLVRMAVTKIAGLGGKAGGQYIGLFLGGLAGSPGGPTAAFGAAIGNVLGGAIGGFVVEGAVGLAYDAFLADWVKKEFARSLFESLSSGDEYVRDKTFESWSR